MGKKNFRTSKDGSSSSKGGSNTRSSSEIPSKKDNTLGKDRNTHAAVPRASFRRPLVTVVCSSLEERGRMLLAERLIDYLSVANKDVEKCIENMLQAKFDEMEAQFNAKLETLMSVSNVDSILHHDGSPVEKSDEDKTKDDAADKKTPSKEHQDNIMKNGFSKGVGKEQGTQMMMEFVAGLTKGFFGRQKAIENGPNGGNNGASTKLEKKMELVGPSEILRVPSDAALMLEREFTSSKAGVESAATDTVALIAPMEKKVASQKKSKSKDEKSKSKDEKSKSKDEKSKSKDEKSKGNEKSKNPTHSDLELD